MAIPPNTRACALLVPVVVVWAGLVCPAQSTDAAGQEQTRQQRPHVTEVPSAHLPEKYRNQPRPPLPDPPSMRYASLRDHEPPRIVLPTLDPTPYIEEDKQAAKVAGHKVRGGVMRPVNITPEKDGEWSEPEPGVRVWRVEIQSPGAKGIRLKLSDVHLGNGAQLFLYSSGSKPEILRESHAVWYSRPFNGETVRVEMTVFDDSKDSSSVHITDVGHLYRAVGQVSLANDAGTCNLDVACYPDKMHAGASVARIDYISGNYIFYCSAVMLNNNTGDFSPLLLTAHHCGVDTTTVHGLDVQFFYRDNVCNANDAISGQPASGLSVLGDSPRSDATLLEIAGSIPREATWAGWNIGPNFSASPVFSVHHPESSFQRIAFGATLPDGPDIPVPSGLSTADFQGVQWSSGTVEPGSSGGPLFNQNEEVVGQLFGGYSSCSNPTGWVSYGKLSTSLPSFTNASGANYLEVGLGDDALFGNQSRQAAAVAPVPGTIDKLVIRIGFDDWFQVTVPANQQLGYTISTADGSFLMAEIYRGDETTASGSTTSGVESKLVNLTDTNQAYYIHVTISTTPFGTRAAYSLITHLYSMPVPTFANIFVSGIAFDHTTAQVYYQSSPWPFQFYVQYSKDPSFATFQQTDTRSSTDNFMVQDGGPIYTLKDLDPGSKYYFRPVVFNTAGSTTGTTQAYTVPAFLAPVIQSPQDGSVNVSAQFTLNWAPDYSSVPFDVYFGITPNPPLVLLQTYNIGYAPFNWTQHADYNTRYYWRVSHTYRGVTTSSPIMSFTTETGPQIGLSANPLNLSGFVFSSPSSVLTITNTGGVWFRLDFSLSVGFGLQNNCVIPSYPNLGGLNPGQSCTVTVATNHPPIGISSGTLTINASNVTSISPIATVSVPVTVRITDVALNVARPSRSSRSGVSAGQAMAHVTVAPSAPISMTATMSCDGLLPGVSCSVQPRIVDLSSGLKDVDVFVTIAARAGRLAETSSGRSSRLRAGTSGQPRERSINVNVTATVGSVSRNVMVPVVISQ